MRALANEPPPQLIRVVGASGAGKTSMVMRVLADLAKRLTSNVGRAHEVLIFNVGDDPDRLASPATVMRTIVQLIARQGHRFASIDPDVLRAAAADELTVTGTQVDHRLTLDAKVASYSAGLKEAYETARFGDDPARARQDFEDVITLVSRQHRPVILIDDTEHFVRPGATGGVDTTSVSNLFHNGIRALADVGGVDLVVAMHPKYQDVEAVKDVTARFGFISVDVPTLQADRENPGLAAILQRRLNAHNIDLAVADVMASEAISQLEGVYFLNGHDLREVLDLAASAATHARLDGAERIERRHVQPLLDRLR
jgi:Cdc6-like AAA superfamily ATPase